MANETPAQERRKAAIYTRVSTFEQHPETQLHDLRQLALQRGFTLVGEFTDRVSGVPTRRPGLDELLRAARRREFDVLLVWSSDRLARSVRHFLELLEEFHHLGIEFVSFREAIDTGGELGRAVVVIIGAIAELERNLIIERVRAGMRRAKLEGRRIGRRPLTVDRSALRADRARGLSLSQIAKLHGISRTSVCRLLKPAVPEGCGQLSLQGLENATPKTAA
jgi:DNA invertase Pin-like site-specific DNA recombinase